jgi:ATP synthase I subunit
MDRTSLSRIERMNYILGGVLVAAAGVLGTRDQVLGALVGVLLCSVNFSLVVRIVEKMTSAATGGQSKVSGLWLAPKLLALMSAAALALFLLPISAVMLAAGFSVFLLSIGVETVRYVLRSPAAGRSS